MDALNNKIYNAIMDSCVISYQAFKKIRSFLNLINKINVAIAAWMLVKIVTYNGPMIACPKEESIEWFAHLSNTTNWIIIGWMFVAMIIFIIARSFNHGKNNHDCYKAWAENIGYKPYNK